MRWPQTIGFVVFVFAWARHALRQNPADLLAKTIVLDRRPLRPVQPSGEEHGGGVGHEP